MKPILVKTLNHKQIKDACDYAKKLGFAKDVVLKGRGKVPSSYLRYAKAQIEIFKKFLPNDTIKIGQFTKRRTVVIFETETMEVIFDYLNLDKKKYLNGRCYLYGYNELLDELEQSNIDDPKIKSFIESLRLENDKRDLLMIFTDYLKDNNKTDLANKVLSKMNLIYKE